MSSIFPSSNCSINFACLPAWRESIQYTIPCMCKSLCNGHIQLHAIIAGVWLRGPGGMPPHFKEMNLLQPPLKVSRYVIVTIKSEACIFSKWNYSIIEMPCCAIYCIHVYLSMTVWTASCSRHYKTCTESQTHTGHICWLILIHIITLNVCNGIVQYYNILCICLRRTSYCN
jgi:hypothetical protein